jgi:hypothetical protein
MQQPFYYVGKLLENRFTRQVKCAIIRSIAARNPARRILNRYYDLLGYKAKSRFHARYSKIFRNHDAQLAAGQWIVVDDPSAPSRRSLPMLQPL